MVEDNLNLNGEFLGVSALAICSASWYLQIPLLFLVATLFMLKVSRDSKEMKELTKKVDANNKDDLDIILSSVNWVFFGFAVPRKNLSAYWAGFIIYLITLSYAAYNLYSNVTA